MERQRFRAARALATIVIAFCAASAAADVRIAPLVTGLGSVGDAYGSAVAMHGDRLLVNAPLTMPDGRTPTGVADVYVRNNDTWTQEATLIEPPGGNTSVGAVALGDSLAVIATENNLVFTFADDGTGWRFSDLLTNTGPAASLALSGDTLVSGATVYVRSGDAWTVQATLPLDSLVFVSMASLDGDTLALTTSSFLGEPTVEIYERSDATWTRVFRSYAESFSQFYAVAVSGDTVMYSSDGVHVVDRGDDGTWTESEPLDAGTDLFEPLPIALDGDRAVIGSPIDDTAYLFTRSGGVWSRADHFADADRHNCFAALALADGRLAAGCSTGPNDAGLLGRVDVFDVAATPVTYEQELDQGNSHLGSRFGTYVGLSASSLIASSTEGAYLFGDLDATTAQQAFVAIAVDGRPAGPAAVAIDGDRAALFAFSGEFDQRSLSLDVLTRTGNTWSQDASLPLEPFDDAVSALALGDDALIHAPSAGQVCDWFRDNGTNWTIGLPIFPLDGTDVDASFCTSAAIAGDTLVIGAPTSDDGIESEAGAAYVFVRDGDGWTEQARLVAAMPLARQHFGFSVAIAGDTIAIGANDAFATADRGAAFVFKRAGTVWPAATQLVPPGSISEAGSFGFSVAVSGDESAILVGAPVDAADTNAPGVVYAFEFDGTAWQRVRTLGSTSPPSTTPDYFGWALAYSGNRYAIGAPGDRDTGAVFVGSISDAVFADGFDPPPP